MSRIAVSDRLRLGALGLLSRKGRTVLSTLGVAIGITALVGVLGLSESSRADLDAQLDALGTNLLTVAPGDSLLGEAATLPEDAPEMIRRMPDVESATAIRAVPLTVRKSDLVPEVQTGGLGVAVAEPELPDVLGATLRSGQWIDATNGRYPVVVLGAVAARRLAVSEPGVAVWIGDGFYAVIGILDPVALAPELDELVFIGAEVAATAAPGAIPPTTVYARVDPARVDQTRSLLARTANPEAPNEVVVSRPSDALAAQAAADETLTALTLGLGAVALLVGGIGIANVMVISVLERRREIGVRRALGATRGDIGSQFLTEAMLLALLGGAVGAVLGVALTVLLASRQGWMVVMPWTAIAAGLGSALAVGVLVGIYPAMRAAGVPPTEALRAT